MAEGGGGGGGAPRGLSLSTGAIVLRSVSLFLARGRAARPAASAAPPAQSARARPRAMTQPNKLPPKTIEALKRKTHFNKAEIEGLYAVYRKLVAAAAPGGPGAGGGGGSGGGAASTAQPKVEGIDQSTFREVLHNTLELVTEEALLDRMFSVWDRAGAGALRFEPWACGLSVLLRGSPAERRALCFSIYDLNSDGYITRDEMLSLLKNCLLKQPGDEEPDEGVKELVELVLRKLDADKDGRVSFQDYQEATEREPLLLEAFGQCLPAGADCRAFIESLQA